MDEAKLLLSSGWKGCKSPELTYEQFVAQVRLDVQQYHLPESYVEAAERLIEDVKQSKRLLSSQEVFAQVITNWQARIARRLAWARGMMAKDLQPEPPF